MCYCRIQDFGTVVEKYVTILLFHFIPFFSRWKWKWNEKKGTFQLCAYAYKEINMQRTYFVVVGNGTFEYNILVQSVHTLIQIMKIQQSTECQLENAISNFRNFHFLFVTHLNPQLHVAKYLNGEFCLLCTQRTLINCFVWAGDWRAKRAKQYR